MWGAFTLIAGVIGVSNIMLVIVKERTHEIGIRRAIGATPFGGGGPDCHGIHYFDDGCRLFRACCRGGYVLEVVSNALERTGAKTAMFSNPEVDLSIALIALGILILCGALAGLIPGTRALSMKPVEAIRTAISRKGLNVRTMKTLIKFYLRVGYSGGFCRDACVFVQ